MQVVGRLEVLVGSNGTSIPARPAAPARAGMAKAAGRVLRMSTTPPPPPTAEEQLPMEGTGTFGKF